MIHRELKPGNVILTTSGAAKLVDFGLAKDIGAVTKTSRRTIRSASCGPTGRSGLREVLQVALGLGPCVVGAQLGQKGLVQLAEE